MLRRTRPQADLFIITATTVQRRNNALNGVIDRMFIDAI
jgi:hypothetical protein